MASAEIEAGPKAYGGVGRNANSWVIGPIAIAALVAFPVLVVLANVLTPAGEVWRHLVDTVLWRYISNTIWLGLQDQRGIYKSTDLGENWTLMVNGIVETVGLSFRGISVDPDHPDLAALPAHPRANPASSWPCPASLPTPFANAAVAAALPRE